MSFGDAKAMEAGVDGAPIRIGPDDFLIVIDVQNDFLPGGAFGIEGADDILPVLNALGARFDHVVMAQDWHPPNHISFASNHEGKSPWDEVEAGYGTQAVYVDHCVQGTRGAEFHSDLRLDHAEAIIRKGHRSDMDSNSAFLGNDGKTATGLSGYLQMRGCRRVFLAGLAFDGCVLKSAEDAHALGYEVIVVSDASYPVNVAGSLDRAQASLKALGIAVVESASIQAGERAV